MPVYLPDCDLPDRGDEWLSDAEKRELILRMAEEGEAGLDRFIEEMLRRRGAVATRFERIRSRLEAQARRLMEDRKGTVEEQLAIVRRDYRREVTKAHREVAQLRYRLEALSVPDPAAFERLLMENEVLAPLIEPRALRWYERWWAALVRLVTALLRRIADLFYRLFGRRRDRLRRPLGEGRPVAMNLSVPGLEGVLGRIVVALRSGEGNLRVDRLTTERAGSLRARARLAWDRVVNPERYQRARAKAVEEELRKVLAREKAQRARRRRPLEARSRLGRKRKSSAMHRAREEIERLRREEEKRALRSIEEARERARAELKRGLIEELAETGYARMEGEKLSVTSTLIDRFADIILSQEIQALPRGGVRKGSYLPNPTGVYRMGRLRHREEEGRLDIAESVVNASINHPGDRHLDDRDLMVYRDERGRSVHAVLMFDRSGSMEENYRLEAAKRATLALYKAVQRRGRGNVVDLVSFHSEVEVMDLVGLWKAEATGFTNTGEALFTAAKLLRKSGADSRLVYLVTDGLPEAWTAKGGSAAGDLEKAMAYALQGARALKQAAPDLRFTLILLEPEDPRYVRAAEALVKSLQGVLIIADPKHLAHEMLRDFLTPSGGAEPRAGPGSKGRGLTPAGRPGGRPAPA